MKHPTFSRRTLLASATGLASAAALGAFVDVKPTRAAAAFEPPAGLVDAARKEGRMVLYTATFIEVTQEVINAFNQRFPFVKIDLVRAPGGQLITRVQTEAASGKLVADVVDHSDRALMKRIEHLFQPYAPPNAKDFNPAGLVAPMLWPTVAPGWSIAYNSELVKNPPKNWMDLCKPEYGDGQIAQVVGPSGGTTWTRAMFERQVLGEDYWARQAATKPRLYPSGAPLSDSLVRGEVSIAPLIYDIIYPKKQAGAPVEIFFGPEGVPIAPYATGIPKTAKNLAAARLFLDWRLSPEGQLYSITKHGDFSMLKNPPGAPPGFDPKVHKLWVPNFQQSEDLHDKWLEEWNKVYGYRQ